LELMAFGQTDIGIARTNNEDNFIIDEKLGFLAVADGMGGHVAGEMASKMAALMIYDNLLEQQTFTGTYNNEYSPASNNLNYALSLANLAVYEAAERSPHLHGMGTTVAAVLLSGNRLSIAHIGDSRVYLIRSGGIAQLTDDHSLFNEQIRLALIADETIPHTSSKNILTKALGTSPSVATDLSELTLFEGDILLLCTDGLSNMIGDEDILQIIMSAQKPESVCGLLINAANEKGGKDNITAVIGYIRKKKWYSVTFDFLKHHSGGD